MLQFSGLRVAVDSIVWPHILLLAVIKTYLAGPMVRDR